MHVYVVYTKNDKLNKMFSIFFGCCLGLDFSYRDRDETHQSSLSSMLFYCANCRKEMNELYMYYMVGARIVAEVGKLAWEIWHQFNFFGGETEF